MPSLDTPHKPLAISCGDPAGIGPMISIMAAKHLLGKQACVLFGDSAQLQTIAHGLDIESCQSITTQEARTYDPQTIYLIDVAQVSQHCVNKKKPSPEGGKAQLLFLNHAMNFTANGSARALVTAPMSKEAVTLGGAAFSGHTEHLAEACGLQADEVSMLFLGSKLRVGTVSTHLSVADAAKTIQTHHVFRTIKHLAEALRTLAVAKQIAEPCTLFVTGLNPHAGENGLFGKEEILTIGPAVEQAQQLDAVKNGSINIQGPLGAETALRWAAQQSNSGVVTMLHDQATIPCKLLDWANSVNVTWGLPFVRTSVDHGVAYDAAKQGSCDPSAMICAAQMARTLSDN